MNGLDLFSGIGGISIALEPWVRTVAYCERDRYAQSVLLSRMQDGSIDKAPIWDDVTTLKGVMLPKIDIIFGGFPCQDISVAGNGKGLAGERSGLFFEIVRLAKEIRAPFIFLENVPAIRTRGLREVIRTLTEIGYDCRWTCLSAASVGANHKRERWFLLAHANRIDGRDERKTEMQDNWRMDQSETKSGNNGSAQPLANSYSNGTASVSREDSRATKTQWLSRKDWHRSPECSETRGFSIDSNHWSIEPSVGRVVNGLPMRMDRIKCLGNAVVPIQARTAFMKLSGIELSKEYFEIAERRIEAV